MEEATGTTVHPSSRASCRLYLTCPGRNRSISCHVAFVPPPCLRIALCLKFYENIHIEIVFIRSFSHLAYVYSVSMSRQLTTLEILINPTFLDFDKRQECTASVEMFYELYKFYTEHVKGSDINSFPIETWCNTHEITCTKRPPRSIFYKQPTAVLFSANGMHHTIFYLSEHKYILREMFNYEKRAHSWIESVGYTQLGLATLV